MVGVHLVKRGAVLLMPELQGGGTYDWRASFGDTCFEVECKSISLDKGRKVHREQALLMHHLVQSRIWSLVNRIEGGLFVRINVPDRFPTGRDDVASLAEQTKTAILCAQEVRSPLGVVNTHHFQLRGTPFEKQDVSHEEVTRFLMNGYGVENNEAMTYGVPGKRAFLLVLQSLRADRVLDETFPALERAARMQLTGERPGVLVAKFEALHSQELHEIGIEFGRPTVLRMCASKFLDKPRHQHVVSRVSC